MQCAEVLELVEPIAAGDLQPDERVRGTSAQLSGLRRCARVGAAPRDAAEGDGIPAGPPGLSTSEVLQRIRRDRWQAEQNVDRLFNVAIVAAVILVAGGLVAMLNVETVLSLTGSTWAVLKEGGRETARTAAPTVATYIAAVGLLASALGMWAWAERRMQF